MKLIKSLFVLPIAAIQLTFCSLQIIGSLMMALFFGVLTIALLAVFVWAMCAL